MKIDVDTNQTVGNLIDYKQNDILRVNHEYQRGLRWTSLQKQMFIDSIFRGYRIPTFYFHKKERTAGSITNTYYDIVDGQQRIDAIYSYSEGAFPLLDPTSKTGFRFPNFVKKDICHWGGKRFNELSEDLKQELKGQEVVIYEITTQNENEIRDLFIRLQGGTPLTPQDKRDSWPGNFTEFVLRTGGKSGVDKWYGHDLFKEVAKVSNESRRRQLVAQIFMQFASVRNTKKFCDQKSSNIDEFYHAHVDFDEKSDEAKRFEYICQILGRAFREKPKVVGHYLIHLFLLTDQILDEYVRGTWETDLAKKLHEFDNRCRQASQAAKNNNSENEFEKYWQHYATWTRTNSDIASTVQRRHAFFAAEMSKLLALKKLDEKRTFSEFEKQTVFFRDMELCQFCKMSSEEHKVHWGECEFHHVTPYTKGGQTVIDNAALMHKDCHPKSENQVNKFEEWWRERKSDATKDSHRRTGQRGQLPPEGTKIKFEYLDRTYFGEINDNKIVLAKGQGTFKSFSRASKAVTHTSRNGWRDWYIQLPGEEKYILADNWRPGVEPVSLEDFLK